MSEPFRITPVHDLLLRGTDEVPVGIYQLHLATAEQLCRLHYSPGSIKAIKARLKALTDHGYLMADAIPSKEVRKPYYYALSPKGLRYLEQLGIDTHASWRAPRELDRHGLFIQHTLETNDVLISAALLHQTEERYRLHSFLHERVLRRRPFQVQDIELAPDAFLDFRLTLPDGEYQLPVLLEHDRDTEQRDHFRRRIRAHITLLQAEVYREQFAIENPMIAFTTFEGAKRLKQMREWTLAELRVTNEPKEIGMAFWFAALDQPIERGSIWLSRRWYTPFETEQCEALLAA